MTEFNTSNNFFLSNGSDIKAAIFVAHPDDETVWMGGTILKYKDWDWDIIVSTHNENDGRSAEFMEAIKKYREQYGVRKINYRFIEAMDDEQDYHKLIKTKMIKRRYTINWLQLILKNIILSLLIILMGNMSTQII